MIILLVKLYDLGQVRRRCPEDDDMLIPLVFDDDVIRCMEMSVDDSEKEYFDVFVSYISDKFKEAVVKVQIF